MINDFIGVYENAVPEAMCDALINHFEKLNSLGVCYPRSNNIVKDNNVAVLTPENIDLLVEDTLGKNLISIVWQYYDSYIKDIDALNYPAQMQIKSVKLQKTNFSEGYHVWHYENGPPTNRNRVLTWSVYLNDVDEGGETEFLYQRVRIKPKKGSLLLWPAGFTHAHRGNPPLSNVKYIATSWIEYQT
jgi:hypothetical protein